MTVGVGCVAVEGLPSHLRLYESDYQSGSWMARQGSSLSMAKNYQSSISQESRCAFLNVSLQSISRAQSCKSSLRFS